MSRIVIGWGRLQPVTVGHQLMVDTILSIPGDDHRLYLTKTHNLPKNPLPYDYKFSLAKQAFGDIIHHTQTNNIIKLLAELSEEFDSITVVCGDDRLKEYETLFNKYNNREYFFDDIEVVSSGKRGPNIVSSTMVRQACINGDPIDQYLPLSIQDEVNTICKMISKT